LNIGFVRQAHILLDTSDTNFQLASNQQTQNANKTLENGTFSFEKKGQL